MFQRGAQRRSGIAVISASVSEIRRRCAYFLDFAVSAQRKLSSFPDFLSWFRHNPGASASARRRELRREIKSRADGNLCAKLISCDFPEKSPTLPTIEIIQSSIPQTFQMFAE